MTSWKLIIEHQCVTVIMVKSQGVYTVGWKCVRNGLVILWKVMRTWRLVGNYCI